MTRQIEDAIQDAYEHFVDATEAFQRAKEHDGCDPETGLTTDEAVRKHFVCLGTLLQAFNAPENWTRDETPRVYLPRYAAFVLGKILDDLLSGRVPAEIEHLFFGRKRPGLHAIQRRAIEPAVRYIVAAERELIDVNDPIAEVAGLYGVKRRSVRRWLSEHRSSIALPERSTRQDAREQLRDLLLRHIHESAYEYSVRRNVKSRP